MITMMQLPKVRVSNLSAYAIFIYGVVLISPIFPALFFKGATFLLSLVLFAVVILIAIHSNFKYSRNFLISIFFILLPTPLLALISEDSTYITDIRYFLISSVLVYSVTFSTIYKVVEIASKFILLLLLGGSIAFILSMNGYGEIGSFTNPDGRQNNIYFFTFSNVGWSNLLRPAGIYDEPGAFSFFICGIAAARQLLGMDRKRTWMILLLGLQTLSVAHVIYMIFHAIASQSIKFKVFIRIGIIFLSINALALLDKTNIISNQFLGRFNTTNFGEGRLESIVRAYYYILDNPDQFFLGARALYDSAGGYVSYWESIEKVSGSLGGNVLFPVVSNGFLASVPYLFILSSLVIAPLFKGRSYVVALGIAALIYNRDYMYVISYSFVVLLIYRIIYDKHTYVK
jgi:hypothetical protein